MHMLNNGHSCSKKTNSVLKHIYSPLADHHLFLSAHYVTSQENVANTLS